MNSSEKERMIDAFLFDSPELKADVDKIKQLNQSIPALEKTLVFKEREPSNKRITYLHNRGEYLQPTEEILADTPSFLPKIPQGVTQIKLTPEQLELVIAFRDNKKQAAWINNEVVEFVEP